MPNWPDCWDWELELGPHLFKRMVDRGFNEVEIRHMLTVATNVRPDVVPGRFIVATRHRRRPWEVVVEPDRANHITVVVTAYPLDG